MDRNLELYINAANSLGCSVELIPFTRNHCKISFSEKHLFLLHTSLSCNNSVSVNLVQNKVVCSKLLRDSKLPGTIGQVFLTEDLLRGDVLSREFAQYADPLYPVVLKPKSDTLSRDVYLDIKNESDLRSSLSDFLKSNRSRVLIEKFVVGDSYRVLTTSEEVVEILKYQPGEITGTGNKTIQSLIMEKKFINDYGTEIRIRKIDWSIRHHLRNTNKNLEEILPDGETITIDNIPRHTTGGYFKAIPLDSVPMETKNMCVSACNATGLNVAGIDFITTHIHEPWRENDCAINELNSAPYMTVHGRIHPEDPEFAPRKILNFIFKNTMNRTVKHHE